MSRTASFIRTPPVLTISKRRGMRRTKTTSSGLFFSFFTRAKLNLIPCLFLLLRFLGSVPKVRMNSCWLYMS